MSAKKKATTKKPVAKKAATKKPVAKKTVTKKAAPKKTAAKKAAPKKVAAKKTAAKKATPKKATPKKAAPMGKLPATAKQEAIATLAAEINNAGDRVANAKAIEVSVQVAPRKTIYLVPHLRDMDKVKVYVMGNARSDLGKVIVSKYTKKAGMDTTTTTYWNMNRDKAVNMVQNIEA